MKTEIFAQLEQISARPRPFEFYTAVDLWTDDHRSKRMLALHLDPEIDAASRKPEFINRSVEWITARFGVGLGTKIAGFGCGPGLYTTRLAQRHAEVTGIDFSARSIQYARTTAATEGLSIHYVNQNYFEYESDSRFHLILMIMCDFCALSFTQRKNMLQKFHALLEPGGFVLLDVYSLEAFKKREETETYEPNLHNGFWSSNKYYGFLHTFKYKKEKIILDKYTIMEATGTKTIYNWFQCFSPEALAREFMTCGFSVQEFYSDVAGSAFDPESTEFAVVASKNNTAATGA